MSSNVDLINKTRIVMSLHTAASQSAARNLNIFRFLGDLTHLISILLLGWKMSITRSCAGNYYILKDFFIIGISLKSQVLYLIVYLTRYLDIFSFSFGTSSLLGIYNLIMKLFFIASQLMILHAMLRKFRATHNPKLDSFRIEFLIIPCLVLAIFVQSRRNTLIESIREYFWTFSILLESVAILPQLYLLQKTGEAEMITTHYLISLGSYRALYLINWIYRYFFSKPPEGVVVFAGLLQTILYSDLFYVYYKRVFTGRAFRLPL